MNQLDEDLGMATTEHSLVKRLTAVSPQNRIAGNVESSMAYGIVGLYSKKRAGAMERSQTTAALLPVLRSRTRRQIMSTEPAMRTRRMHRPAS